MNADWLSAISGPQEYIASHANFSKSSAMLLLL